MQAFYDNPCVKNKRSTSIGYGKKSDFTNTNNVVSPGPSIYEKSSPHDSTKEGI